MNKTSKIIYWVSTFFILIVCIGSGLFNIIPNTQIESIYLENKLPLYLAPFLGILKILGAITITTPTLKRFHEVSYAGLIFYFIGATYVVIASGGSTATYSITTIILIVIIISYLMSLKVKSTNKA